MTFHRGSTIPSKMVRNVTTKKPSDAYLILPSKEQR